MPCSGMVKPEVIKSATKRLEEMLKAGTATVVIDRRTGAIAFRGFEKVNDGVADVCAFRILMASRSFELKKAVMRAEALAGRKVDEQAIAAGQHSHDGGATWSKH